MIQLLITNKDKWTIEELTLLIFEILINQQQMKAIIIALHVLYLLCIQGLSVGQTVKKPTITYVTGLWDVNRANLGSRFTRSYQYYLKHFAELLETESNLIIYGDNHLREFVRMHRTNNNTVFIQRKLQWFQGMWYTPMIEKIINHLNQTDKTKFIQYSAFPQYGLKMYNPVVMSKLFLMNEARSYDIFESDYLLWVDGGFTHVLDKNLIVPKDNTLQRIPLYFPGPFFFQTNDWNQLKHGFKNQGEGYVKRRVVDFVWANYIGGKIQAISTILSTYQNFKRITLQNYDMWTDQSVFSIMLLRYPYVMVSINNLTLQKFDSFRFHQPQYHPTQEMRYFNLSSIKSSYKYIHQDQKDHKLILIKSTQNEDQLRERIDYFQNKQMLHQQQVFYDDKLSYMRKQTKILGGISLMLFLILILIKIEIGTANKQQQRPFQV